MSRSAGNTFLKQLAESRRQAVAWRCWRLSVQKRNQSDDGSRGHGCCCRAELTRNHLHGNIADDTADSWKRVYHVMKVLHCGCNSFLGVFWLTSCTSASLVTHQNSVSSTWNQTSAVTGRISAKHPVSTPPPRSPHCCHLFQRLWVCRYVFIFSLFHPEAHDQASLWRRSLSGAVHGAELW